jgi:hypothetical protein
VADSEPTPLVAKLGIVEGSSLVVLAAPGDLTLDLPAGVHLRRQARGTADVVLAFFTEVAALEVRIERVAPMVFPAGALWIAWPKRASGVATDMTDGDVRSVALPLGLVDNKVCAIHATWTGLRLVWRRDLRPGTGPTSPT